MNQSVTADELCFHAEWVAAQDEQYTPEFVVHGIYFGEGDPEQGGQHWNFTRSLDDDDGVCTVKEIQQVTAYGGIISFVLTRQSLVCEFDDATAQIATTRRLVITYDINEETWQKLVVQAKHVFDGETYFKIVN